MGAPMGADIALTSTTISMIILTIGAFLAILKKYESHRYFQSIGVFLSILFVSWLMIPKILGINEDNDLFEDLFFAAILILHISIGLISIFFGAFVALRGNNLVPHFLAFENYKLYMRISYLLFLIVYLLGLSAYILMPDRISS